MKLAKALAVLVLVTLAALACAADGDPPAVIGRLNHISGQVSFAPAQSDEDWVAASINRPVTTGDRLWTDVGGRAEMHVGSLAVRMDSQTSLDVLNLDDRALQLRLAQGSVNVRVRRAVSGEPVEIATPEGAVILTRPGAYRVSVDSQGYATSIAVRGGGQVEVFAPNGSLVVRDGEQATFAGSREDVAIAPAPDEFDRWAAQRDVREDRVAATRYVPAEMTGYEDLDQYGTWRNVPEYGSVWQPTAVSADWAPYRYGHWVWITPWGWTWVDDAPWGFAPSHYGRWIWLGRSWAWAPGRIVARPVYAPALVAFIGGPNFSVSIGGGTAPAVGWVPLGWHEPYRPWYRASQAHVRNVNVTNVTNTNITNIRYANRGAPSGVTVVSRENFAAARPVQRAVLKVSPRTAAAAPVTAGAPVGAPSSASLAQARPGARPPAEIRRRQAVAVSAPPDAPARTALRDNSDRPRSGPAPDNGHPGVRVIERRERFTPAQAGSQRAAEKEAQSAPPAAAASVREHAPEKAEARQRDSAERRVPAPPAAVTTRPTFDRSGRAQEAPQREQRAGRAEQERQGQGERAQQAPRLEEQHNARQRPSAAEQKAQPPRVQAAQDEAQRQQQPRQRVQDQAEQRDQQQANRQAQQRLEEQQRGQEQARQREQQGRQRAQEQAVHREAERQSQERARVEARQHEQAQRADEQARQRAQQQAEQRGRQQAEHQAQQRAQVEARQQQAQQRAQGEVRQQQAQRAEKQVQQGAQQQERAREERRESHEKAGRERARADKSDKG